MESMADVRQFRMKIQHDWILIVYDIPRTKDYLRKKVIRALTTEGKVIDNFYRTVLKKLCSRGSTPRREAERYVYAPVHQPIPKRAPLGGRSFWRLAWEVAKQWNKEFEG